MKTALDQWVKYAENRIAHEPAMHGIGTIRPNRLNIELTPLDSQVDFVITSPPYANRLDYSRMWAPELEVAAAIWQSSTSEVKREQIGSTVVSGKSYSESDLSLLPAKTLEALEEIRTDTLAKASESYYYPFFRNYAISLSLAINNMVQSLQPNGILIIFVRDTVRKDVLFSSTDLIQTLLQQRFAMELVDRRRVIIRSHIGLMRRASTTSLQGLAQHEWWLAYRKS